jgi:hypothetical protein
VLDTAAIFHKLTHTLHHKTAPEKHTKYALQNECINDHQKHHHSNKLCFRSSISPANHYSVDAWK